MLPQHTQQRLYSSLGAARFALCAFGALCFIGAALAPLAASAQYPGFGDPGAVSRSGKKGAVGTFTPVLEIVDGGVIPFGASAQVVVRFRNDTSKAIETGLIRLYPSSTVSADVTLNQCIEGPLPSGAECAIALTVKALQPGQWRIEMLMKHTGRSRLVASTISGSVESGGDNADRLISDIEAIPGDIDFETLTESQRVVEPVLLRNVTSNPITINNLYIDTNDQSGFSLSSECDTLSAGQACIAMVTWSPKLAGRSSGVLVVEHSGPAAVSSVMLRGEFNPTDVQAADVFPAAVPGKGLLVSSQEEVDFGSGIQSASTITVSLVNAGDTDLQINNLRIAGSDNGLSFTEGSCQEGDVLAPIEACPLTLSWSPTRVGTLYDDVQIRHDGARGVLVIPVRGDAAAAVSQNQKSIVLNGQGSPLGIVGGSGGSSGRSTVVDPQAVLDGYRITSFAKDRAIVNGPGGSRIVFNSEDIVLGGVLWGINIKRDGIEFSSGQDRILMLFDRSLSAVGPAVSSQGAAASSGSSGGGEDTSGDE